jgi:hypothetical protein
VDAALALELAEPEGMTTHVLDPNTDAYYHATKSEVTASSWKFRSVTGFADRYLNKRSNPKP